MGYIIPDYIGLNSGRSVSMNVNKTRKYFSRNFHGARMFPQCSPVEPTVNIVSIQFLFPRCKLCLRYSAGNFAENLSMRAIAKILRLWVSEHSSTFFEQFEQRPKFGSTFKLNGTNRYPLYFLLLFLFTDFEQNIYACRLKINLGSCPFSAPVPSKQYFVLLKLNVTPELSIWILPCPPSNDSGPLMSASI